MNFKLKSIAVLLLFGVFLIGGILGAQRYFNLDELTTYYCFFISGAFLLFYKSLLRLSLFTKDTDRLNLDILSGKYVGLAAFYEKYKSTLTLKMDSCEEPKTSIHAEEVFTLSNIFRSFDINLKLCNTVPGILSGLGVIGTFIGLTFALKDFHSGSVDSTLHSVDSLLDGMNTAFFTSIVGMLLSMAYMIILKKTLNDMHHMAVLWCSSLDKMHYISEVDVLRADTLAQQQMMMQKLADIYSLDLEKGKLYRQELECVKDKLNELCVLSKDHTTSWKDGIVDLKQQQKELHEDLREVLIGYDDSGEEVMPGSVLVHLYEESANQSQALESFTTDLSNELNSSLGKTMNTSIVPLIQNLEKTHQDFNEKLDRLAVNIQSPATDMVTTVVDELKSSMLQVTQEFKDNISSDTMGQMNMLATHLSQATQILDSVPSTMQTMSDNITLSFGNIKDIIGQLQSSIQSQQQMLLDSARSANQEMGLAMKTQLEDMMSALSGSVHSMSDGVASNLTNTKDIINQLQSDMKAQQLALIEHSSQTNMAMMGGMKKQFEEMMALLNSSVSSLHLQQNELIEGQGKSTREIDRLLLLFNESIQKVKVSNQEISRNLVSLQTVGENMDKSAEKLNEMSNLMTDINKDLQIEHQENVKNFYKVQKSNQDTLEAITDALDNSKAILAKYTEQYTVISNGLDHIFKQIDEGLRGYSSTLREGTKDALAEYSGALTDSTKGLKSIAETLNDTAEELNDSIDKIKNKLK